MCLITRQGFPTATQSAGMERVTTLPAPMTLLRPIVTPGKIMAPPPIHTLSSIFMGSANVLQMALLSSQFCMVLSFAFVECVAVHICTLEAIKTLLPISIRLFIVHVDNDFIAYEYIFSVFAAKVDVYMDISSQIPEHFP